ncbi:MAG: hypothetical protein U1E36_08900 [Rickettsiales bacterium]
MLRAILMVLILASTLIVGGFVFLVGATVVLLYLGFLYLTGRGVVKPVRQWGYTETTTASVNDNEKRVIIDAQYEEIGQTKEY